MAEPDLKLRYSMLIQWSVKDGAFLVTLPEWDRRVHNPVTQGATYDEAVKNGREVLELLVEDAQVHGESLPAPRILVAAA